MLKEERQNCRGNWWKVIIQLQDDKLTLQDDKLTLQDDKLTLQGRVEELESGVELTKLNGKTYSPEMRMKVYDAIVAGVPTKAIITDCQIGPSLWDNTNGRSSQKHRRGNGKRTRSNQ